MTPAETGEELLRRERQHFKWTCISAAFLLLILAQSVIFILLNNGKVASMAAAGASPREIQQRRLWSMIAGEYAALGALVSSFIMLCFLVKWLSAIRRRRRAGVGLPLCQQESDEPASHS